MRHESLLNAPIALFKMDAMRQPLPLSYSTPAGTAPSVAALGTGAVAPVRSRHSELYRKLFHITPGLLPFLLPLVPHPDPLDWPSVILISLIAVAAAGGYISVRQWVARPGERDFILNAASYAAVVVVLLTLFRDSPELTATVVAILAFGDGGAYIGGTLLGRRRLPWNPHKTWVGTASFVLCAAPLATLAYWTVAQPAAPWSLALLCGAVPAVLAAAAESLDVSFTDNLRVGFIAGLAAATLHYAVASFLI